MRNGQYNLKHRSLSFGGSSGYFPLMIMNDRFTKSKTNAGATIWLLTVETMKYQENFFRLYLVETYTIVFKADFKVTPVLIEILI